MNNIIQPEHRILYNKTFKDRTKELRKNMTKPEKKLRFDFLKHLDKKDIDSNFDLSKINFNYGSLRIYKQRPIENFIVDFLYSKVKTCNGSGLR